MYASVSKFGACAGIEVTASHNPIDYNGMKIVGRGSLPLSSQEFKAIKELAEANSFIQNRKKGVVFDKKEVARAAYIEKILSFVDCSRLKPLKIVINSGNGAAGPTLDAINKKSNEKGCQNKFCLCAPRPKSNFSQWHSQPPT